MAVDANAIKNTTFTIVKKKETEYPAGGPTVPGSSTGIGSTMTKDRTRLSKKYYGTGGYATGSSAAEIQVAREKVLAEEKARKEAFSRTGGIVGIGGSPISTSVQDIQTDSQAIKTATQVADQVTKEKGIVTTGTIKATQPTQQDFFGQAFGMFQQQTGDVEITYKTSTGKTTSKIVSGDRINEVGQKQAINEAIRKIESEKGILTGETRSIPRMSQAGEFIVESAAQYPLFMGAGMVANKVTNVVTGTLGKVAAPITQSTAKVLGGAADDVFNLLSPTAQKVVTDVGSKVTAAAGTKVGSQVVEKGSTLLKTEVVGEALRQAGLATPDVAGGTYLALTPNRVFTPTKETDVAAQKTYSSARVSYYGGERQLTDPITGAVVSTEKVPGKASMGESFAEGFLPGIKVATGFSQEFETAAKDKIKDLPEYKSLKTDKEKAQFEKEFKDYYLNIGQIGGTVGQVLIETGGEVTGGGRALVLSPGGINSRAGAAVRFGIASGTTGIQEGVYSAELQAKTEKYTLSDQDRLNAAILGGGVAGTFGVAQGASMGTKYQQVVNITGELADYPGEPLGDYLGGGIKKAMKLPDIKVAGSLFTPGYGPDVSLTGGKSNVPSKGKPKSFNLGNQFLLNEIMGGKSQSNINLPGTNLPIKGIDNVPTDVKPKDDDTTPPGPPIKSDDNVKDDTKEEDDTKDETKEQVSTNTPTFVNVPSTVPVIAPQGLFFPGFFPIGYGSKEDARGRTKIYDELSAASKRFEQLSGLPFTQKESVKRRKTVIINGKEFRIGKRVKNK